ncbi:MAG: hypothetical protein ACFFDI_14925 [Promethearchaeota archaeon]
METLETSDTALIWGVLRNIIDFNSVSIPGEISLVGTTPGEFPVDDFHPIFLEVSKSRKKIDLSGRANFITAVRYNNVSWFSKRIIALPVYESRANVDIDCLKQIFQSWEQALIPEDIPCIALAIKVLGRYSKTRDGEFIVVLLLWASNVARIFELDWFEGPLEDCISPEWYISVSELMNPLKAFEKMKELCSQVLNWKNTSFTFYTIPECLGALLKGKRTKTNRKDWKSEWSYSNQTTLLIDLENILGKIGKIIA